MPLPPNEETDECERMDIEGNEDEDSGPQVYLPHKHGQVMEGTDAEELVMEESAYQFYYPLNAECSSLSFDWLQNSDFSQSSNSQAYPLTVYIVAGSQAAKSYANKMNIIKVTNIIAKKQKENSASDTESDSDSSSAEDEEDLKSDGRRVKKPRLVYTSVSHTGGVNRMRSTQSAQSSQQLVATWSDAGMVNIWNMQAAVSALDSHSTTTQEVPASSQSSSYGSSSKVELPPDVAETLAKPLFCYRGHQKKNLKDTVEGFALDWSKCQNGWLATGDMNGGIHIWQPQAASWEVTGPLPNGHTASVEDIQWAPSQPQVLISCSCDASLLVWDLRQQKPAIQIAQASSGKSDINVISWNRNNETLLLSGDDAGCIRVWDLRRVNEEQRQSSNIKALSNCYVYQYAYHQQAITSIEWHPSDTYTFAASSEDDQVTFWDCSVEKAGVNAEGESEDAINELPAQLLFIHQGQKEVKEAHWHPYFHGVVMTTALDGYNLFRTVNI